MAFQIYALVLTNLVELTACLKHGMKSVNRSLIQSFGEAICLSEVSADSIVDQPVLGWSA